jgi:thiol-disulfide isomerase/thioredoxin
MREVRKGGWRGAAVLAALLMGAAGATGSRAQEAPPPQPAAMDVPAPELVGGPWLNSPTGAPLSLAARRGKVTLVHFWTFGCINCLRNLPAYARWQQRFKAQGVMVIGVHTPETPDERVTANVVRRTRELGIRYPVLLDQRGENWRRWDQQYWPTVYLVDRKGRVRYVWLGELEYAGQRGEARLTERLRDLLRERG